MTYRTIIVDDEPLARSRLRALLGEAPDFSLVAECSEGADAIETLNRERPDAVFLVIEMPEVTGVLVARAIEYRPAPAVVFVTAFSQHAVEAFEVSALDYLLKPFDSERFAETLDRIRAYVAARKTREAHARLISRLSHGGNLSAATSANEDEDTTLCLGDIEISLAARTVKRSGRDIPLRPKEFDLFARLIAQPGDVLDRKKLLCDVWGYRDEVRSRTVDTHVAELRRKLELGERDTGYIETVFGIGYRVRL